MILLLFFQTFLLLFCRGACTASALQHTAPRIVLIGLVAYCPSIVHSMKECSFHSNPLHLSKVKRRTPPRDIATTCGTFCGHSDVHSALFLHGQLTMSGYVARFPVGSCTKLTELPKVDAVRRSRKTPTNVIGARICSKTPSQVPVVLFV